MKCCGTVIVLEAAWRTPSSLLKHLSASSLGPTDADPPPRCHPAEICLFCQHCLNSGDLQTSGSIRLAVNVKYCAPSGRKPDIFWKDEKKRKLTVRQMAKRLENARMRRKRYLLWVLCVSLSRGDYSRKHVMALRITQAHGSKLEEMKRLRCIRDVMNRHDKENKVNSNILHSSNRPHARSLMHPVYSFTFGFRNVIESFLSFCLSAST